MSDEPTLAEVDFDELWAILETPTEVLVARETARVAAAGRKRKKCTNFLTCRSVKWKSVYAALRRKGKSKKFSAQVANSMHNRWLRGEIKRKTP